MLLLAGLLTIVNCMRYYRRDGTPEQVLAKHDASWIQVRTLDGREIPLREPRVENDSLIGDLIQGSGSIVSADQRVAIETSQISAIWTRHFDFVLTAVAAAPPIWFFFYLIPRAGGN